ncbi:hypothetical protein ACHAWF_000458, partial [Thalassiosira exigua]
SPSTFGGSPWSFCPRAGGTTVESACWSLSRRRLRELLTCI